MSASALPALSDLQGLATIDDLRGFLHVDNNLWNAILHQIGDPGPHIRVIAALPPQVLVQSCVSATFRTAALMLSIASLSVLLAYEKTIERLASQWPRCWGLIAYICGGQGPG